MANHFVHERAICESEQVGAGTRIWAFAHILPGAKIGSNCNICDSVFIENDVIVGDEVTIKCGVQLWDGLRVGNRVFIGPNATFTNDRFPRSKEYPEKYAVTTIEDGASVGANATILPGLRIGHKAMVGAGAVVTHDVPPYAIVKGNPAQITGYVNLPKRPTTPPSSLIISDVHATESTLGVGGCLLMKLPQFKDLRGELVPVEFEKDLPFIPKRQFFVFGVPGGKVRGEHAHKKCKQFLCAIRGSLNVVLDNGVHATEVILDAPSKGLYLPAGIWGIQYKFSADAILAVYASDSYDADDYIRSYDDYLEFTKHPSKRESLE